MTTATTAEQIGFRENRFLQRLCVAMAVIILFSAVRPESVYDWFLENALVFTFVGILAFTYRSFSLSNTSYVLLFLFLCFHEWGAHYKYSDVPLGEWMKPWLSTKRNDYDRVIHFTYGLFCAYPLQEWFMRAFNVRNSWRYYLPVEAILAMSAFYELLEAMMANILTPERGEEFVGMQGDIWDSQKDMFVATLGAVTAMAVVAVVRYRRAARVPAAAPEAMLAVRAHR